MKQYGNCFVVSHPLPGVPDGKSHMLVCAKQGFMPHEERNAVLTICHDASFRINPRPVWAGFALGRSESTPHDKVVVEYRFEDSAARREHWAWATFAVSSGVPLQTFAFTQSPRTVDDFLSAIEHRRPVMFELFGERDEVGFEPEAPVALADFKFRCRSAFDQ